MELSVVADDKDVVRLQCSGQITQNDVQKGRDPFEALLGWGGYGRKVLLNMDRTSYIDSSGVSWLLVCHKHFLQAGGKLVLHTIPPMVFQVLQLLRMSLILNIATDEAAARAVALAEKKP